MSNTRKSRQSSKPETLKDVLPNVVPKRGTDPDTVQRLFDALSKHFEPRDILEEIWLHDIARITASIETFRVIEKTVQFQSMREHLNRMLRERTIEDEHAQQAVNGIYHLTITGVGASKTPDGPTIRVSGKLNDVDIRKIASVADVIQKLQRERDRIYAQFDRKRRPMVMASVKVVEAADGNPNPADKLAE